MQQSFADNQLFDVPYLQWAIYAAVALIVLTLVSLLVRRRRQLWAARRSAFEQQKAQLTAESETKVRALQSGEYALDFDPSPTARSQGATLMSMRQDTLMQMTQTMYAGGKTLALPGSLMLMHELDFTLGEAFAEGGAGTIYHGKLTNSQVIQRMNGDTTCVIKVMKPIEDADADDASALFNNEISIIWLLKESIHIIKLVGYCPQPAMILMKSYPLGSLEDVIHKQGSNQGLVPDNQWTPKFILRMMRDVSSGLADMHENGLVHNDVKPGNVLLDKDVGGQLFCALCDFGVTSIIDDSLLRVKAYKKSRVKGASLVYAAPEILQGMQDGTEVDEMAQPELVKAGDIYSFSMLAYELTYRRIPWWDVDDLDEISSGVINGKRPTLPAVLYERRINDSFLDMILTVMEKCQVAKPLARLELAKVTDMINEKLNLGKRSKTTTDSRIIASLKDSRKLQTKASAAPKLSPLAEQSSNLTRNSTMSGKVGATTQEPGANLSRMKTLKESSNESSALTRNGTVKEESQLNRNPTMRNQARQEANIVNNTPQQSQSKSASQQMLSQSTDGRAVKMDSSAQLKQIAPRSGSQQQFSSTNLMRNNTTAANSSKLLSAGTLKPNRLTRRSSQQAAGHKYPATMAPTTAAQLRQYAAEHNETHDEQDNEDQEGSSQTGDMKNVKS